jgi:4-amino-4-deoxy-L-arabinose transferase-like glycosyltransferase
MLPRLPLPPSRAVLLLIAAAFALPGLAGHDPWKTFDAIALAIAHHMHVSGDWLVPRLAGDPWPVDPPLFHWIALAFGKSLGWLISFHNAARLAGGVMVLVALWAVYLAARHGAPLEDRRPASALAALLLLGSLGLFVHSHTAVPDLATLAAQCAAFVCLARAAKRPLKAGVGFGAAIGIAFLSTGPLVPSALAAAALLAHLVCDELRGRRAPQFIVPAALAAIAVGGSWPLALWLRAPEFGAAWWAAATQPQGTFGANLRYFAVTLSWFAWPAWLLAGWSLWTLRREWRSPRVFVPAAAAVLLFLGVSLMGPPQDVNALALLPPLALLGAQGVASLRRGAANALDWFGVMTFTVFAGLVWLGYAALVTGRPAQLEKNMLKTAPGFAAQFDPLAVALAAAFGLAWLYVAFFTAPSPTRGVTRWAAGVALLWATVAFLWMPWIDHQKSYRAVALQLKSRIPANAGCIAGSNLGAAQRAVFAYHAAIRTRAWDRSKPAPCPLVIVQGSPRDEAGAPGPGWAKLADVGRPGDKAERYRLYRRQP